MPRRTAITVRAAVLLLTVLIATDCIVHHAVQPRPVTAEVIKELALAQFTSSEPVTVLSVRLTTIGAAMQGTGAPDKNAPAWAVRLSGSFFNGQVCGPTAMIPPQCPAHTTTALVLIDARTGETWGQTPAP